MTNEIASAVEDDVLFYGILLPLSVFTWYALGAVGYPSIASLLAKILNSWKYRKPKTDIAADDLRIQISNVRHDIAVLRSNDGSMFSKIDDIRKSVEFLRQDIAKLSEKQSPISTKARKHTKKSKTTSDL